MILNICSGNDEIAVVYMREGYSI